MQILRQLWFIRTVVWMLFISLLSLELSPTYAMVVQGERRNAQIHEYWMHAGVRRGLTQTLTPERLKVIENRSQFSSNGPSHSGTRFLTQAEMRHLRGSGPYRNVQFAGQTPSWQRSFHDVNICNGNLFKSYTDTQIAAARGAGLALQRTYNSQDPRIGPFGVGWTHAYDIRNTEAGSNNVSATGFFGKSDSYHRDADGLYSAPAFKHDLLESTYGTTLVNGQYPPTTDTDTGLDGSVKHYFTNGSERDCDYIQDRHGNTTRLAYNQSITLPDGRHPLQSVTDPSNRSIAFTWANVGTTGNPAWRITQVQGPFVNGTAVTGVTYIVAYNYYTNTSDPNAADNLYNLQSVTLDPSGLSRTTSYIYTHVTGTSGTENALLTSITDPLGHVVNYTYTLSYNTNVHLSDGNDPWVFPTTATGTAWVYQIVESAGIDSTNNPRTITWTFLSEKYQNNPGLVGYITNTAGTSTTSGTIDIGYSTDPYMRFNLIDNGVGTSDGSYIGTDPSGYTLTYDTSSDVVQKDSYAVMLDDVSGLVGPNYSDEVLENYTFGASSNPLTHWYQGGTPQDVSTYYGADEYFQKHTDTDMNGHTSSYTYGLNTDTNFGNRGSVLSVQDARYAITGKQYTYSYNQYGQKVSETNEDGLITQYTYGDQFGNLTQTVQDPGDSTHLNLTANVVYDACGRIISSTDSNGRTKSFTFNVLGQPLTATSQATSGSPAETITYTYEANGRTQTISDNRGATSFSYEAGCDRVHSVTDPLTGTISYTYMPTGEKASVTLPGGGTWTYQYRDPYNGTYILPQDSPSSASLALQSLTDDQGRICHYYVDGRGTLYTVRSNEVYDVHNSLVSYCQQTFIYDHTLPNLLTRDWLTSQYTKYIGTSGTTLINENDYTFDNTGQRLSNKITNSAGTVRTELYGYDELNRLATVDYGDGETQGYTLDPMGNRQQMTDTVSGTTTTHNYSYDPANRLTMVDSGGYTNDANGNTLTGGGRTNTWDSQNRLIQCILNGTTSTFTYGADGLRRRAVVNNGTTSTTTDYALDGDNTVREFRSGANYATYLTGPAGPQYRRDDTTGLVRWYVYDGLGSVVAEVDPSGNVTASNKYDIYGNVRGRTGTSTTSHGFAGNLGHESEANTGLIYMRARYCDPSVGRFVSRDPKANGANWFVYCLDNPINAQDRDGCKPVKFWLWYAASCGFFAYGFYSMCISIAMACTGSWGGAVLFSAIASGFFALSVMGINEDSPNSEWNFNWLVAIASMLASGWAVQLRDGIVAGEQREATAGVAAVAITACVCESSFLLGEIATIGIDAGSS